MREYLKAKKESSIYEHRLATLGEMIPVELERKVHLGDLLEQEKRNIELLYKTKEEMLKGMLASLSLVVLVSRKFAKYKFFCSNFLQTNLKRYTWNIADENKEVKYGTVMGSQTQ